MNVYDPDVEESTEQGVWDNNNHIAWKQNNVNGIVAHIDDEDMFGGVDRMYDNFSPQAISYRIKDASSLRSVFYFMYAMYPSHRMPKCITNCP